MKRSLKILLILIINIILFSSIVNATIFSQEDISLDINDEIWAVFTRENIEYSDEIHLLWTHKDIVKNRMENQNVYIYALQKDIESEKAMELSVIKTLAEGFENLHMYDDEYVKDIAKSMEEATGSRQIGLIEKEHTFVVLERKDVDENNIKYVLDYITYINGNTYQIRVEKSEEFSYQDRERIDNIVNSVSFDIKESENTLEDETIGKEPNLKLIFFIAAIAIIFLFIVYLAKQGQKERRR